MVNNYKFLNIVNHPDIRKKKKNDRYSYDDKKECVKKGAVSNMDISHEYQTKNRKKKKKL